MKSMKDRLFGHLCRRRLSPLDALALVGCLSLSQRCGEFERQGHHIDRKWKPLPCGKRVMTYKVVRPTAWTA